MNRTRIEALHAAKIPASLWPLLSLPRGRLGLLLKRVSWQIVGATRWVALLIKGDPPGRPYSGSLCVATDFIAMTQLWTLPLGQTHRSAPTSALGQQPGLTTVPSPLRGVLIHLTGALKERRIRRELRDLDLSPAVTGRKKKRQGPSPGSGQALSKGESHYCCHASTSSA
jgi:hypothetical protein